MHVTINIGLDKFHRLFHKHAIIDALIMQHEMLGFTDIKKGSMNLEREEHPDRQEFAFTLSGEARTPEFYFGGV